MFVVDLVRWWYVKGWRVFFTDVSNKIKDTQDTFSIGELFRTFFKPYRQIGTEAKIGEPGLNIFLDKMISRIVGMASRTVLIALGIIALILENILGGFLITIWPLIPVLPVAGIVLTIVGVTL